MFTDPQETDDLSAKLARALATLDKQASEIEQLRRDLGRLRDMKTLVEALRVAAVAREIAPPLSHALLLEMIVATASQVIDAQAASLFLLDEQAGELVFEIVVGGRAAEVKKIRVPLGHGIAGLVALTGHAMATAGSDSRQATDIADRVGYHPQAILCVPLFYQERVIGVLELLDKKNGRPFDHRDMELLGLFATQAAVAIELSRTRDQMATMVLEALGVAGPQGRSSLEDAARAMTDAVTDDTSYREAIAIARLAHQIAVHGNREARLITSTLEALAEYLRSRPRSEKPY